MFLIFVIAATAITLTLYFGMQEETRIVLPKKGTPVSSDGTVKKTASLILWAVAGNADADKIRNRIPGWETALNAKISLRLFASRTDFESARIITARNREAPDVFPVSAADAESLDKSGALQRLPLASIDASQWVPQTLAPFQRGDNALLAYPAQYSLTLLYYNKAEFDRVGIAYPDDQWNWDSLLDVAKALYKPSVSGRPPHYGIEVVPTLGLWNAFSLQLGAPVYNNRQWNLGSAEGDSIQKEALQFLIDIYQKYTFAAPTPQGGKPLFFLRGQSAMLIGGSELMKAIRSAPDVNWGVTLLPAKYAMEPDRLRRATPMRLRGWAVNSRTLEEPSLQAARGLAERLSAIPLDGWSPARLSGTSDDDGGASASPIVLQSLDYAVPPYIGAQAPRIYEIADSLMGTFSSASTTTGKFLAKIHTLVDDIKPDAK
ncbi:extracellular solute-binding protein [Verrucomicrobium sp. GAS474]|uniref:ABC transporter substrate-binding protein n=1 Tax=Verrucomicrobium sp. GAS474 TaxID=1882831 RepID=UPI0008792CEF|nr:extracellular solute-binding protein [Verrucomicrobium sp. GAS474]SDU21928.1 extracellular solute-binding protein [Verrucomicrobium sp. GAS474]